MRLLFRATIAALLGFLMAVVGLHFYAVRQTREAARLQQAVLRLKPGSSTFADARHLVSLYGSPGDYDSPCDESLCEISIAPMSLTFYHKGLDNKFMRAIGVRPASYEAWILILDGRVAQVQFGIFYRRRNSHWIQASTHIVDSFSPEEKCLNWGLRRHKEYALFAGQDLRQPGDLLVVRAGVSINANAEERRHAQNLTLGCVNSLRECELSDLMPLAYQDWVADQKWEQDNKEKLAKEEAICKPQLRPVRFVSPFVPRY